MTERTSSAGMHAISPLETDGDLARGIPADEMRAAIDATTVPVLRAGLGAWSRPPPVPGHDFLGYLLVDGPLARHVLITGVGCTELLGPGDLMRPWDQAEGVASVPFDVDWEVLEPASIAVLDERVTRAIGRWPVIAVGLSSKMIRRTAVTSALGRLAERGAVIRRDDGSCLLHGKPPVLPLDDLRDVDADATVR